MNIRHFSCLLLCTISTAIYAKPQLTNVPLPNTVDEETRTFIQLISESYVRKTTTRFDEALKKWSGRKKGSNITVLIANVDPHSIQWWAVREVIIAMPVPEAQKVGILINLMDKESNPAKEMRLIDLMGAWRTSDSRVIAAFVNKLDIERTYGSATAESRGDMRIKDRAARAIMSYFSAAKLLDYETEIQPLSTIFSGGVSKQKKDKAITRIRAILKENGLPFQATRGEGK